MNSECHYCEALDLYNLEPAKPVNIKVKYDTTVYPHKEKEVTRLMHKERNGVSFSLGVECKNQEQTR